MKKIIVTILASLTLILTAFGQGTIILWNESVNGPFSQISSTPTPLSTFLLGTNSILGAVEIEPTGNNWFVHEDFFTIQIPEGYYVDGVYIAIDGPQVGLWLGNPGFSSELAFVQNPSNGDLLTQWGINSIIAGKYGVDMANHNSQSFTTIANYRLDFVVQAVPEPSTMSLALVGLGLIACARWKRGCH